MFRKMILSLAVLVTAFVASAAGSKPASNHLVFSSENTISLRGEVNEESINQIVRELQLRPNKDLILYISSPGGSIMAGQHLIETMKGYQGTITCFADEAISMAFVILQACEKRLVAPTSTLMQHEASYELRGEAPNNLSFVTFLHEMLRKMDSEQAARLGMPYEDFKKKTANDWWMDGTDAIAFRAADATATTVCSKELAHKTFYQEVDVIFAKAILTFSQCPIIRAPLKVEMKIMDKARTKDAEEFLAEVKERFSGRYDTSAKVYKILNNQYQRIR